MRLEPDGPDESEDGDEVTVRSTTIITGSPNDRMAELHHRMPVILPASSWQAWLDPDTDPEELPGFLVPASSEVITVHPVSTDVNNVRNKGEELTARIELDG